MSSHHVHPQIGRAILFVLVAFGITGTLIWFMLPPRSAPVASTPGSRLGGATARLLGTSRVFLPALKGFALLPLGPITGATDATSRAVVAANREALGLYGVEPFAQDKSTASFALGHWSWHQRRGYGKGDLEAEVIMATNGILERVTVRYTTQQLASRTGQK